MYQVLLAVDSDEQRTRKAVEAVSKLPGKPSDLDVVILNVFKEFKASGDTMFRSENLYDETDFPESVSVAKNTLEKEGVSVTTRREHGDPAETIISVADEIDADTIAITGRKRSPTGKVLFGSVTQSILLSANQPVHVAI